MFVQSIFNIEKPKGIIEYKKKETFTKIEKLEREIEDKEIEIYRLNQVEEQNEECIEYQAKNIQALMKFRSGFTNHLNSLKAKKRKMINIDELLNLISCE